MQHDRTSAATGWPLPRVRGLGVCDALELTVEAIQLPALLDELDARRAAHEQALAERPGGEEAEEHRLELRRLRAVRDQLGTAAPLRLVMPAPHLSALVEGAARAALDRAAAVAARRGTLSLDDAAGLDACALALAAWARALAEVRELEWFAFELPPES